MINRGKIFKDSNALAIGFLSNTLFASLLDRLSGNFSDTTSTSLKHIGDNHKILSVVIADDDIDDRLLFKEIMAEISPKIKVHDIENGISLMQSLNESGTTLPDILFLDINMPGKNGKECLREIKNNARFNDLLVVIYSTSGNESDIKDTYTTGANLYIRKPNTYSDLKNVIRKVLSLDINNYKITTSKKSFLVIPDAST